MATKKAQHEKKQEKWKHEKDNIRKKTEPEKIKKGYTRKKTETKKETKRHANIVALLFPMININWGVV